MTLDLTPYAGRWVALLGEQVVGVGYTAVEAEKAARHNRPRDRFVIRFVEVSGGQPLALSHLLEGVRPLLAQETQPVYLVGGAVRDALLGRASHDLDFVVPQDAIKLTFRVANSLRVPAYVLDKERDAGRAILPDNETYLDFTRFRGATLAEDLGDRDFTINAIAMPATAVTDNSLIDPTNGRADLEAGIIRHVHDNALRNDPVRAVRALRLAHSLGFTLAPETVTAVKQAAASLNECSIERIRDEFLKLMALSAPDTAVAQMHELSLLPQILPKIAALETVTQSPPHHENVLAHTISVLRWLVRLEKIFYAEDDPADAAGTAVKKQLAPYLPELEKHWQQTVDGGLDGRLLLRLGALYHDVGKKETRTEEADGRVRFFNHDVVGAELCQVQLQRMKLSNQAITHIQKIVRVHMRPLLLSHHDDVSRRAVYRYFQAAGEAGLDVAVLALADHLAVYDGLGDEAAWARLLHVVVQLLEHYFTQYEETVMPPLLVNGRDLMQELHLPAGPEIGRLLRLIQEAQAVGEVQTRADALEYAHRCRH